MPRARLIWALHCYRYIDNYTHKNPGPAAEGACAARVEKLATGTVYSKVYMYMWSAGALAIDTSLSMAIQRILQ